MPITTHPRGLLAAAFAGLLALAGPARADVIYNYTGNDFNGVTLPYTTSNYLSIVLDFSEALGPNFSYQQVFPVSYILTGGIAADTLDNANSSAGFFVQTDGTGNIDGWYIGAGSPTGYFQSQYTRYDGVQFDYIGGEVGQGSIQDFGSCSTRVGAGLPA